jgi:hypothetical protein
MALSLAPNSVAPFPVASVAWAIEGSKRPKLTAETKVPPTAPERMRRLQERGLWGSLRWRRAGCCCVTSMIVPTVKQSEEEEPDLIARGDLSICSRTPGLAGTVGQLGASGQCEL